MATKPIQNVLICGLGGIGCVCAANIYESETANLKVLIDESRFERYTKTPTVFNGKVYNFDYILPDYKHYKADLIIIATKDDGLKQAITNIKNFITDTTIIISLLNGINSENEIIKVYKNANILHSFYIGGSCIRNNRTIIQNGDYNIVIGTKDSNNEELLNNLSDFLRKSNIKHYISPNFEEEYWKKFFINIGINQLSAYTGKTLKEIKKDNNLIDELKALMKEAELISKEEGLQNHARIYNSAVNFLLNELDDANPSMLQDVKAGRKTEVDIFAGFIINRAKQHNIAVPENTKIYNYIKNIENKKN